MAKKNKKIIENIEMDDLFGAFNPIKSQSDMDLFNRELTEDEETAQMLIEMALRGITPEQYSAMYDMVNRIKPMFGLQEQGKQVRKTAMKKDFVPMSGSLLLRIQMNDVSKPPMWREVEVPAKLTFLELHYVIQAVNNFEDCHLWQFGRKAYSSDFIIGIPSKGDSEYGIDDATDDAAKTPISAYLSKEGDKLEYVYDFGDDWIFTVTVKKVLDKELEHPVCVAYKSDMNPMEDSGGVWSYLDMRDAFSNWNKLTKKQKEVWTKRFGYEEPEDFYAELEDIQFDMDFVNESLQDIKP